jgi:hypothetical protein
MVEPRLTHRYVLLIGPSAPGHKMLDEMCVESRFRPRSVDRDRVRYALHLVEGFEQRTFTERVVREILGRKAWVKLRFVLPHGPQQCRQAACDSAAGFLSADAGSELARPS